MAIRKFKPTSPGRRFGSVVVYRDVLTKGAPEKSLLEPRSGTGGRNKHGHITSRHRGGRVKRMYRMVDFLRNKDGVPASVIAIEYDPNRSANIALLHYKDGAKSYILAPNGLKVGQELNSGPGVEPTLGNSMLLGEIPLGMEIHNIELKPGKGGSIARSAGMVARLLAREDDYATVVLPSGETRMVQATCRATIGSVGNGDHQHVSIGKAGRNRLKGIRPQSRGSAMNPVAHPMGGGEGRRSGGRHPVSPWGKPAKGGLTRKPKAITNKFIIRRRKKR
ncbi:MAG: 50S ribosomal protein L2 [Planctomycetes bacterium]|nr:50S ribosomal protein L2 [Planctomycetota bacterium]